MFYDPDPGVDQLTLHCMMIHHGMLHLPRCDVTFLGIHRMSFHERRETRSFILEMGFLAVALDVGEIGMGEDDLDAGRWGFSKHSLCC